MNNSSGIERVRSHKSLLFETLKRELQDRKVGLVIITRRNLLFDCFVDRGLFIGKCVLNKKARRVVLLPRRVS